MKPYQVILIIIVILGLGVGGYYLIKKKNNAAKNTVTAPTFDPYNVTYASKEPAQKALNQTYTNDAHKIIINYPDGWTLEDLGGPKNVTDPLVRENIAYVYDPANEVIKAGATVKLIRFVLEKNTKIKTQSDWFNYVKAKIDSFMTEKSLIDELGYQLISVDKIDSINGHFVVQENYTLKNDVRARDYYVFANDLYQFIFQANKDSFDKYANYFDKIAQSFNIK